jgi:hypothetical protein
MLSPAVTAQNRATFLSSAIDSGDYAGARYWARTMIADINRLAAMGEDVTQARSLVFGLLNRLRSSAYVSA